MASTVYTIPIPHLPRDHTVLAAGFRDVQNAPFLRQQLLEGNPEFEYALLDARMVRNTLLPVVEVQAVRLGNPDDGFSYP